MKTSRQPYTAAVIGGTWIGVLAEVDRRRIPPSTHAGAYAAHPRIRFTGIVEADRGRIAEIRAIYPRIPIFRSLDELLALGVPDIISVATPPADRARTIRSLARMGVRAVLSEVPLAERQAAAAAVVSECAGSGTLLMANHLRRCNPLIRRVREHIRSGQIGDVVQVAFLYTGGLRSWGSHGLDLIVHFLGLPERAHALRSRTDSGHRGDPNVDGWLEYRSGVKVAIQTTHFRDHRAFELDFIGRRGRVRLTDLGFRAEIFRLGQSKRFSQPELVPASAETSSDSTFYPVVDHIVGCLDGKERPLLSAMDALRVGSIIEAMERSAKSGGAGTRILRPEPLGRRRSKGRE